MANPDSKRVIYAALIGNFMIAVAKFIAAAHTGSSAMLSEAVHSVVDTGNQGLLLYGIKRASRPADEQHPFGYGRELYFWTFVVAILIFGVGAGISIYEGVQKIAEPHPLASPHINYIVLAIAMVFEAVAWWIAFQAFRKTKGSGGYIAAVRHSKDPTIFTVLFEDSAAMLGLIAAFIGILAAQTFDLPILDGVASVVIGVILAITAGFLAFESKGLLIGEGASRKLIQGVRTSVSKLTDVKYINELLTMHLGPREVLLNLSLDFQDAVSSEQVEKTVSELERDIKEQFPEVTKIFIEVQGRRGHEASKATPAPS